jgi:lysophospholipase L1-like esterase
VTLVALGDSVTRGHTEPMLGVHAQSWAQWLAEALDLPLHNLAENGARVPDLLARQVPRLQGRYDVAAVWVGINDTRALDWDAAAYAKGLDRVLRAVDAARTLLVTIPLDLGRPPAAPKPAEAGGVVRRLAAEHGAGVLDVSSLAGFPLVLPDAVHLTALGQLAVGAAAARALGAPVAPSGLDDVRRGRAAALLLGVRWGRLWTQDVRRRAVERVRPA